MIQRDERLHDLKKMLEMEQSQFEPTYDSVMELIAQHENVYNSQEYRK